MMQVEVEAKTSRPRDDSDSGPRYLVLGDFGGRSTEPLVVDRDNLDDVLARLDVAFAGIRMREVEDFHPDRLYPYLLQGLDELAAMRESAVEEADAESSRATPAANLEEILRPASLLEQIVGGGGDPFENYVRELARTAAAPVQDGRRAAHCGSRRTACARWLHHPRFQWAIGSGVARTGVCDPPSR